MNDSDPGATPEDGRSENRTVSTAEELTPRPDSPASGNIEDVDDEAEVTSDRSWAERPEWDLVVVAGLAIASAIALAKLTGGAEGSAYTGVLAISAVLALVAGIRKEFRERPFEAMLVRALVTVAVGALVFGLIVVTRPEEPLPRFEQGVDGIAVAMADGTPEELGEWVHRSLLGVDAFDGCADIVETPIEVWDVATTARAELDDPANSANADLLVSISTRSANGGGSPLSVDLGLLPLSRAALTAGDPFLFSDFRATAASVDRTRDLDQDARVKFPELESLPALIAGLRELDNGSTASSRCALRAAQGTVEGLSDREDEFLAALDVVVAATYVRDASRRTGDPDDALESAESALEDAAERLSFEPDDIRVPDDKALAVIDANRAGVRYLRVVASDGSIEDAVTFEEVQELIADFDRIGDRLVGVSAASVLVNNLSAKLALASAVEGTQNEQFLVDADVDRAQLLDLALDAAQRGIAGATGEGEVDPAVSAHLADTYYTQGQAYAEQLRFSDAAASYSEAAALVGGSVQQSYRLYQAVAHVLACESELAESLREDVRNYLTDIDDEFLLDQLRTVDELAERDNDC